MVSLLCLLYSSVMAFQIQQVPTDSQRVDRYIALSKESMNGNFPLARNYGDSALVLAEKINYEKGQIRAHKQIATASYYAGDLDLAITHYQKQIAFYEKNGEDLNRARTLSNIGLVKRNQGQYDEAMKLFFEALEIKEALGETNSIAFSQKTIGETYAILKDTAAAAIHFDKAIQGFREVENTDMEHTMLLNLGGFFWENGAAERGLPLIQQGHEYFKATDDKRELARSYYLLGGIYYDFEQLNLATQNYEKAQKIFESMGANFRINGCERRLSLIALKQKNYNKAEQLATQVLNRGKSMGADDQVSKALYLLYEINKANKKYSKALVNLEAYNEVQDSIINKETTESINDLREKYQSVLKQNEIDKMESELQINTLALQQQRNLTFGLWTLVGLLLLIVGLIYKLYSDNRRNNTQLVEKNGIIQRALGEKEVLLKEIHHRVKNNLQFVSSLLNLQSRHTVDQSSRDVLRESQTRINSMLLVHQKLYQEDNLTGVPMPAYIDNLLDSLMYAYQIDLKKVQVNANIEPLNLDVDTAIPIGLILNEIITNAFKYAFKDMKDGKLQVSLKEDQETLALLIKDNGPGLPEDFDASKSGQFGMELVRSLATKLGGDIQITNSQGMAFHLTINKFKKV